MWTSLTNAFKIQADNPELVQSQISALSRQVPILYAVLALNTLLVGALHYDRAPIIITLIVPILTTFVALARSYSWARLPMPVPHDFAVARLKSTIVLAAVLGLGLSVWGLILFGYDDGKQRLHTAFYICMTVIPCIFCLTHLRAAAFATSISALVPACIVFVLSGDELLLAILANLSFVVLAMMHMVQVHSSEFTSLIGAKQELLSRQHVTQALSDQNFKLANMDTLTNLPNRRAFFQQIESLITSHLTDGMNFAVALVDLDGFKTINDCYGHGTGDEILVEVARRLETLPDNVFKSRLGGDEFALLIMEQCKPEELQSIGNKICTLLSNRYHLTNVDATLSASVGFACCPEAGIDRERLVENADYALIHAKQNRRGAAVIFNNDLGLEMRALGRIDQALRSADLDRELSVMLQPIVRAADGNVRSHEVLARWTSPVLGVVSPYDFIRAAERSDTIHRVTLTLFNKTLRAMEAGDIIGPVSFNLSARDIAHPETVLHIVSVVRTSSVEPQRITFEVTETAFMADFQQASDVLAMLRHLGCRVALDDFGSGYSSLSYVHRLPLDSIKIDQSFVSEIETSETARGIVKTIVEMCRNLDLFCIVEGVETKGQVETLRELGCDAMQGYYFSKPMEMSKAKPQMALKLG